MAEGKIDASASAMLSASDAVQPAAPLPMGGGQQQLRGLILQKEKELSEINEFRITTLEGLLTDKARGAVLVTAPVRERMASLTPHLQPLPAPLSLRSAPLTIASTESPSCTASLRGGGFARACAAPGTGNRRL